MIVYFFLATHMRFYYPLSVHQLPIQTEIDTTSSVAISACDVARAPVAVSATRHSDNQNTFAFIFASLADMAVTIESTPQSAAGSRVAEI